jgi:hypothetical protein
MQRLELIIDRLTLEADLETHHLPAVTGALREALRLLADRLGRGPAGRFTPAEPLALERLQVSALAPEELLGPRGAERLAEELYALITRRGP